MLRFVLAHSVEFLKRLCQAARDRRFQPRELFFNRGGWRADYSRQPKNRGQIRLRLNVEFFPQRVYGLS